MKKLDSESLLFTLTSRCRNRIVKEFLTLSNSLFVEDISLE
jgi:hypothetical protein